MVGACWEMVAGEIADVEDEDEDEDGKGAGEGCRKSAVYGIREGGRRYRNRNRNRNRIGSCYGALLELNWSRSDGRGRSCCSCVVGCVARLGFGLAARKTTIEDERRLLIFYLLRRGFGWFAR